MDYIFKTVGLAIITVVLCLFIGKQNKDIATVISMAACCLILLISLRYIQTILTFVEDLRLLGSMDATSLGILLKAVGIGLLAEIVSVICVDAGYAALGKTVQIAAVCGILWTSLPLFNALIDLLNRILGEV